MATDFKAIIDKATQLAQTDKWTPSTWEKILAKVKELPDATEQKPFWRAYYLLMDAYKYTHKNAKKQIEGITELIELVDDAGERIFVEDKCKFAVYYTAPSSQWSKGWDGMYIKYFPTLEQAQEFAIERSAKKSSYGESMTAFVNHVYRYSMHDEINYACDECHGRYVGGVFVSKN